MKRRAIFTVNIFIILGISLATILYIRADKKIDTQKQITSFQMLAEDLSQITENYLAGEQVACDSWASYINNNRLSMQEALTFVRQSRPRKYSSVHIIFTDDKSFEGFSIDPNTYITDNYSVSYKDLDLFPHSEEKDDESARHAALAADAHVRVGEARAKPAEHTDEGGEGHEHIKARF